MASCDFGRCSSHVEALKENLHLFYRSLRGCSARERMEKFLKEGGQTFAGEMAAQMHLLEASKGPNPTKHSAFSSTFGCGLRSTSVFRPLRTCKRL